MWFEILPSFGIVVVAMGLPTAAAYVMNNLIVGNPFRRSLLTEDLRMQYIRNRRLTGNPYVLSGLESIPDEDE